MTKTKRSTFLVGTDCTCCTIGHANPYVVLCPMHEAAPMLLKAAKTLISGHNLFVQQYWDDLTSAILEAEEKP